MQRAQIPTLSLRTARRDSLVAAQVVVAGSFFARFRGLMGRASLPPGHALYLPGTNGIHMLFMRFAIDCLFVGEADGEDAQPVVAIRRALPPWRGVVWYVRGAKGVVELPAGALDQAGVGVGDMVKFEATFPN
jgi:uncharacterized protein